MAGLRGIVGSLRLPEIRLDVSAQQSVHVRPPGLGPGSEDRAMTKIVKRAKQKSSPKPGKKTSARQPKAASPSRGTGQPEELVVFAFRLTLKERESIHRAAGPANASRFVRSLAVAAAQHDEGAIRALLAKAVTN
jgi:hypothetical protein